MLVEPGVPEGLGCDLLLTPSHLHPPAIALFGEQHPVRDLGGLQESPVAVQEGCLQPRGLWCEARVGWIPENLAQRERTSPPQGVRKNWCAALGCTSSQGPASPHLPASPSPEPPARGNKPPSPWALCCQWAGKDREQDPFLLFPADISLHTHKPLATCIVIVIKLMP